jgi:hypothetical protein
MRIQKGLDSRLRGNDKMGVGRELYKGDTFVGWVLGGKNNLGVGLIPQVKEFTH